MLTYTIKKNQEGEFVVRFFKDKVWLGEESNYYTDCKEDAKNTARHITKGYKS